MILKQLSYLLALERERHFGRAAATARVSQPGLSTAIRQLEAELGVPLVQRGHHFNGFTPEGQCILEHARRIQAEIDALRVDLEEMREGLSGRLRLGAIPTAQPLVASLTAPFAARYPRVSITVLSLNSIQILRDLANFELDAGITYLDNEPVEHMRPQPLYNESYILLVPANGPLAFRSEVSWAEAGELPLCLLTPDMQNRRIIEGALRAAGANPKPSIETNSIFNICAHVSSGRWSSIVPWPVLKVFGVPRGTKAIELTQPKVSRIVGLIIADRDPPQPLAEHLLNMAKKLAPEGQIIGLDR